MTRHHTIFSTYYIVFPSPPFRSSNVWQPRPPNFWGWFETYCESAAQGAPAYLPPCVVSLGWVFVYTQGEMPTQIFFFERSLHAYQLRGVFGGYILT